MLKKPINIAVDDISLARYVKFESVIESTLSSKKAMAPVLFKPDATTNNAIIVKSPSLSSTFNASSNSRIGPPMTFN